MEANVQKTKVYNVIIMDRSGSMWDIQKPAIMGFNEVLGGVKAAKAKYSLTQEQMITLVLFDSSSIDDVYWNADPDAAAILTEETYVPGACTPLYDAMGRTLTRLDKELRGDTRHSVAVTVITDGYENDSHEYDLAAIRSLVEHLKAQGWSFAYMGTDHDVHGVSVSLSITNVIQFQKTEEETLRTFKKERRARERWAEEENAFSLACPEASYEERVQFGVGRSARYYEEPDLNPFYAERITPGKVKRLAPGEVFVFGSDRDGSHRGGAALAAVRKFGAQIGVSNGPTGQCYAIPTTGSGITPVEIGEAFSHFVCYAQGHPDQTFLVTELGCGHAGYTPEEISRCMETGIGVPNIHYPISFWMEFEKRGLLEQ